MLINIFLKEKKKERKTDLHSRNPNNTFFKKILCFHEFTIEVFKKRHRSSSITFSNRIMFPQFLKLQRLHELIKKEMIEDKL